MIRWEWQGDIFWELLVLATVVIMITTAWIISVHIERRKKKNDKAMAVMAKWWTKT